MGFGILTIGSLCMLLVDWGGTVAAGIICAYGLYLASRLEKRFLYASVSSLLMIPHGIVLLLDFVLGVKLADAVSVTTYVMLTVGWAACLLFFYTGVRNIAVENGAKRFENRACTFLYFSLVYFACDSVANLFAISQMQVIMSVAKYIIVILMIWFSHSCFVFISTPEQTQKDISDVAVIEKKQRERKERTDKKLEDAKIPEKAKKTLNNTKKDEK